jgi:hypothetical protein
MGSWQLRNELKEGNKANAIFRIYENKTVHPVGGVIKTNQYREQEKESRGEETSFSQILEKEREKKVNVKSGSENERLRYLEGMNQYDRHAMEVFFVLSSKADYRA